MSAISCHLIFECSNCLSAGCQNVLRKCRFFRPRCSEYELFSSKLFILWPNSVQHLGNTECLKPGFHIVVSVVSVVRKKIDRTDTTLWKPPVQMLNTKETTDTTCCTRWNEFYLSYELFSYDRHDRNDRYNDMETRLKGECYDFEMANVPINSGREVFNVLRFVKCFSTM